MNILRIRIMNYRMLKIDAFYHSKWRICLPVENSPSLVICPECLLECEAMITSGIKEEESSLSKPILNRALQARPHPKEGNQRPPPLAQLAFQDIRFA